MNAISTVFSNATHLLCRWHISKNVLANCKKMFLTKEIQKRFIIGQNGLVFSATKEEYIQNLTSLNYKFSTYLDAFEYVQSNQLDVYRDRFVATWTDRWMHFRTTTTNRVESAHAKLKRQLGLNKGNFDSSWNSIHMLLELQHTSIKASFKKNKIVVQHNFKPSKFKELQGNISIKAMEIVLSKVKQANFVGVDISACGCVYRRTYGLPCAHEIAQYMMEDHPIFLDSIHLHSVSLTCQVPQPKQGNNSIVLMTFRCL